VQLLTSTPPERPRAPPGCRDPRAGDGKRAPALTVARKLARGLGVSLSEFDMVDDGDEASDTATGACPGLAGFTTNA